MITLIRTAAIAPGKTGAALTISQEVVTPFKEKYGVSVEVFTPVGGNFSRIAWHSRYENLAQYDAMYTKAMADKTYWELVSKYSDSFIPGSGLDEIWRGV